MFVHRWLHTWRWIHWHLSNHANASPSRDQKMGCCNSVLQLSWENSYRDCGFRFSGPVSQSRGEHFRNRWGRSFQEHVDVEDSRLKPHRIQGPSRILWGKTTQFLLNTHINAGTCASFFGRGRMDIRFGTKLCNRIHCRYLSARLLSIFIHIRVLRS